MALIEKQQREARIKAMTQEKEEKENSENEFSVERPVKIDKNLPGT